MVARSADALATEASTKEHNQRAHPNRNLSVTKKSKKAPWKKAAPKKSRHTTLTQKSKRKAKTAARQAGRSYPNLIDNMNAAKKQRARLKTKT